MESAALIREDFRASDLNPKKESCCSKINWFYAGILLMITAGVFAMGILLVFMIANFIEEEEPQGWKPAGNKIKTVYAENLTVDNVWQEYPRPQLRREDTTWVNLNGLWDYFKVKKGSLKPRIPDGQILVPFPIESSLSGVMKSLTEEDELWYQRSFEVPKNWTKFTNKKIILHFGAVDWQCQLYVNFKLVGEHKGGYVPFSFDISNYINYNKKNTIVVKVFDPTNTGYQAIGKQTLEQGKNIWYSAVSGIWQTVWVENVDPLFVKKIEVNPSFDTKEIKIKPVVDTSIQLKTVMSLNYKGKEIKKVEGLINQETAFSLEDKDFHPWSPEVPDLYDISVIVYSFDDKTIVDKFSSYTAIRKITKEPDAKGHQKIFLNGKEYFNMGTLDQGYFPDGLYTPPSEWAQLNDINQLKKMGFNTIRKHMKVENARFYYHCDRIGMLVWQDMPAGDMGGNEHDPTKIDGGTEKQRTDESVTAFYQEWQEIIEFCKFFQSVIVWVPFNEAWGQFQTVQVAEFTHNLDPSRLVDHASGGNYRLSGDLMDYHHYTNPAHYLKQDGYINVVGEYGGLGYFNKDHSWKEEGWSHKVFNTTKEIQQEYKNYCETLKTMKGDGIAAAIFTQTTDVEGEVNGLLTYDRKVNKFVEKDVLNQNKDLINYNQ